MKKQLSSKMTMTTKGAEVEIIMLGEQGIASIDWGDGTQESVEMNKDYLFFSDINENREPVKYVHAYSDTSEHTLTIIGKNITFLECSNNQLTSLDVSKNRALLVLNCSFNQHLEKIDVSSNRVLIELSCASNHLTNLNITKNRVLKKLVCPDNQLTNLNISVNTDLEVLLCSGNLLSSIDISNNPELLALFCAGNQIENLDVSNNIALTALDCRFNQLTRLDVSANNALLKLWCHHNRLTILSIDNKQLTEDLQTVAFELDCDEGVCFSVNFEKGHK